MKKLVGNWFICKIRYEKTMENGQQKMVNETYVVNVFD